MALFATARLAAQSPEELIVFVDSSAEVDQYFLENVMPSVAQLAFQEEMKITTVDIGKGAPEEITMTPTIVFQNHLGRSIFKGRFGDVSKLKTFVNRSRRVPRSTAPQERAFVLVRTEGRSQQVVILKLPETKGPGVGKRRSQAERMLALAGGAPSFELKTMHETPDHARLLYLNGYAWRDGMDYVSYEIFSQFDCVNPVVRNFDAPLTGTPDRALYALGAAFEKHFHQVMSEKEAGDGFAPIVDAPVVSYEQLGFQIPEHTEETTLSIPPSGTHVPESWTVNSTEDAAPITFAFQAPVSHYAGEIGALSGNLQAAFDGKFMQLQGQMRVPVDALTMGGGGLDETVKGELLQIGKFANIDFTIKESAFRSGEQQFTWGKASEYLLRGTLNMIGREVELDADVSFTPMMHANSGTPVLLMQGSFVLDIRPFNLEEPDGPEPARYTMEFYLDTAMYH